MGIFKLLLIQMNIGEIIKRRRTSEGLTQVELSQKSNLSQSQISQVEKSISENITIGNLRNIAKALNCAVIDLLPESDKKSS